MLTTTTTTTTALKLKASVIQLKFELLINVRRYST